jgi:16S rRNA (cytosine1402-N4)-methyltransferase
MLLDLGVNMEHFKQGERGFSLSRNGPLDMRFSAKNPLTARDILHTYAVQQLEKMLITYGDFSPHYAHTLAQGIEQTRKTQPLETTEQLTALLRNLHCHQKKIAVVFQTLRIETNQELQQLETFLQTFGDQLTKGGRCMIITYHSIEDRIVKNAFKQLVTSSS